MKRVFVFLASLGLLLAGCGVPLPAPTATPLPTSTALPTALPTATPLPTATFTPIPFAPLAEGRIILDLTPTEKFAGTVYGQGQTAILLAGGIHDSSESVWSPFVAAVDKQKFTTITFGYLHANNAGVVQEIKVILDQLRSHGYQRVVCIGASLGVSACGSIAGEPEMAGVVMISGPEDAPHQVGGECNCASLNTLTYPKLYIVGAGDKFAATTQKIYDQASEPKTLALYPDISNHGTDLFYAANRAEFLKQLIDFVNKL